uniref:Putative mRNA capping enzyme n=1 Tax=Megavirus baoshan TaxID=2496520 RepID=A0A3Q8U7H8_9VIRU
MIKSDSFIDLWDSGSGNIFISEITDSDVSSRAKCSQLVIPQMVQSQSSNPQDIIGNLNRIRVIIDNYIGMIPNIIIKLMKHFKNLFFNFFQKLFNLKYI